MNEYHLHLIGAGNDETATLRTSSDAQGCRVVLMFRTHEIDRYDRDFFEAFSKIRLKLEEFGFIPFCYGASLNVFPSGMCRDMGSGLCAYRLTEGKAPDRTDLVRIFESGPDVIPASVERQKKFHADWIKSRGL